MCRRLHTLRAYTDNVFVYAGDADAALFSALFSTLSTVPINYWVTAAVVISAVVTVVIMAIILVVVIRKRRRTRGGSNRMVVLS